MIYIISNGSKCKIGYSKQPLKRLTQLQTGSCDRLELVKVYEDFPSYFEKRIHRLLTPFRIPNSEWFRLSKLDAVFICDKIFKI